MRRLACFLLVLVLGACTAPTPTGTSPSITAEPAIVTAAPPTSISPSTPVGVTVTEPATSTPVPSPTITPTPTNAWPFRLESPPQEYPLGLNYFRVNGVIYNGAKPLYGYKLRVRNLTTGESWLSDGSDSYWSWTVLQWPNDGKPVNPSIECPNPRPGLYCLKFNLKWDSNGFGVPMGDAVWEVTATDGAGNPLSQSVSFNTSATNSKWYYVVFSNNP
jgi:hypothetical protein